MSGVTLVLVTVFGYGLVALILLAMSIMVVNRLWARHDLNRRTVRCHKISSLYTNDSIYIPIHTRNKNT